MRFKTLQGKQKVASYLGIQKENWGNRALFRDNRASIWGIIPYISLYFSTF